METLTKDQLLALVAKRKTKALRMSVRLNKLWVDYYKARTLLDELVLNSHGLFYGDILLDMRNNILDYAILLKGKKVNRNSKELNSINVQFLDHYLTYSEYGYSRIPKKKWPLYVYKLINI